MAKIYYDKDADMSVLDGKTVAIIGYGAQGSGQAQNLRDSGVNVIVSELEGTENYDIAKKHGFEPVSVEEAAQKADIIQILTQDHVQAKVYNTFIAKHMTAGKALVFSHGFNIHFKGIVPVADIDVFMVAPKGPGALVRTQFEEGKGVPCLVAVYQDATGTALQLGLAYAKAIGGTRGGVIETTFKEETETDLFGEQVVLCGGTTALVKAAFDTLVNAGYQPEIAYFECLHELKLITDLLFSRGIEGMRKNVSDTAEWGDLVVGPRIINDQTRTEMTKILGEIQNGEFAKNWMKENEDGRPNFNRLEKADEDHLIEKVGKELREMMPWTKEA
jgi:ketol-acid reductoisomerase